MIVIYIYQNRSTNSYDISQHIKHPNKKVLWTNSNNLLHMIRLVSSDMKLQGQYDKT